jgi:hypothetical protein
MDAGDEVSRDYFKEPMRPDELSVGQEVRWLANIGGWGWTQWIPAKVKRVTPKRVVIEAELLSGDVREHTVKARSLHPRVTR